MGPTLNQRQLLGSSQVSIESRHHQLVFIRLIFQSIAILLLSGAIKQLHGLYSLWVDGKQGAQERSIISKGLIVSLGFDSEPLELTGVTRHERPASIIHRHIAIRYSVIPYCITIFHGITRQSIKFAKLYYFTVLMSDWYRLFFTLKLLSCLGQMQCRLAMLAQGFVGQCSGLE